MKKNFTNYIIWFCLFCVFVGVVYIVSTNKNVSQKSPITYEEWIKFLATGTPQTITETITKNNWDINVGLMMAACYSNNPEVISSLIKAGAFA